MKQNITLLQIVEREAAYERAKSRAFSMIVAAA
jgi:hypothetical protein